MLTKEELEQLDERYVKQTNCDEYRAAIVEANRQQDVLLSAINAKMSFLLAILSITATAVLGAVLKLLIGG
jgi:hypothetical protein|nr:MAG TPA: hypothetical protein [Caudoviricetes sp.]